jgi:hypothetical protein
MPSTVHVPSDYPTIAVAMGHVIPGDTIQLDTGYSNETATVTVNGLIVSGTSSSQNIHLLLGSGIATMTLMGDAPIAVDDNAGNNGIVGNAGANTLKVTAGTDIIDGLTGSDLLVVDYSAATQPVSSLVTNPITNGTLDGIAGSYNDSAGHTVIFDNIDRVNIRSGAGADTLTGGSGPDVFAFDAAALTDAQAGIFDRITDYHLAEGDQLDLSALLAAAFAGGQPAGALVRVIDHGGATFSELQIDSDGGANGAHWLTIAHLDGVHGSDLVNVILDPSQPAGTTITVRLADIDGGFHGDFGGDHRSDVLLHNADGTVALWQLNGGVIQSAQTVGAVGPEWQIAGNADFNGDGLSDVLWRAGTQISTWQMNGAQIQAAQIAGSVGTEWRIEGTGDFAGDGTGDILWRRDDGTLMTFEMNSGLVQSAQFIGQVGNEWHIVGIGDFGGDGMSDILWRRDNGSIVAFEMNGGQVQSAQTVGSVGLEWHVAGLGDFNGDGKSDILWQRDDGTLMTFQMNGGQWQSINTVGVLPADQHIYGTGDFNGDGKADILLRNDNGTVGLWEMDGAQVAATQVVAPLSTDWGIGVHQYDLL